MEPSPAPPESHGAAVDKEAIRKSVSRFKALAGMLFAADPKRFREELDKDKAERRAKRGR